MRKIIVLFLIIILIGAGNILPAAARQTAPLSEVLATEDGMLSFQISSNWYLSASSEDSQTLVAAPDAERAANPTGGGAMLFQAYLDYGESVQMDALVNKTLKDHALTGVTPQTESIDLMGLPATRYTGENDSVKMLLIVAEIPELNQTLRFLAVADPAQWDDDFVNGVIDTLTVLPQQANVPKGWAASIRAPLGWTQDEFSSFIEWIAPQDSPFSGMEIWFQAGFRSELIGQGEAPFVMRSLGVNYSSQVDESLAYPTLLGGLPAVAQPFESFTHTGIAINAEGSTDFGTANLVARAPIGEWTDAHQRLVNAIAASVQILPPTADAAPVGLRTGYRAPDFSGVVDNGGSFSLADFDGKLVFVHFWFVDCPYCREEWPHMEAVYNEYRDKGMVLLAINAIDSPDYIAAFQQSTGYDFSLVLDNGALHQQFGVVAFPSTFVIGPDGVIVRVARGPMSEFTLRSLAQQYLDN